MYLSQSEESSTVFLHIGFPGVGISYCLRRNQKPRVLFNYTGLHRISRSLHVILRLSQSEAPSIVFLHSIAGSGHVIVCLSQPEASCVVFLHWVGWSWPVIVCLPHSEASCIVLNAGLTGVGISLCVCHNQKPREMF